ncbi:MAG: hypothetical protein HYZ15_03335 [Sphingobacteriales bacterium]|nr:hypothetical protein [Sphingobacteriales bacterium]
MKKYVIYTELSADEFDVIKSRLRLIEENNFVLMKANEFSQNLRDYNDVLSVDYIHEDNVFYGNIGFSYVEEKSSFDQRLFCVYILKAFDENGSRYFKRRIFEKLYNLEDLISQSSQILSDCLEYYRKLEKSDLTEHINLK